MSDQQVYSLAIQALFERKERLVREGMLESDPRLVEVIQAIARLQSIKEVSQLLSTMTCGFKVKVVER